MFEKHKKKYTSKQVGHVRIIGGRWRNQKLPVLCRPSLRPTLNQVRETLFNWLLPVIRGAHCLDCFAGSGALGIEALSRGAASITLLEKDPVISRQLTLILTKLHAQKARVITVDSVFWLSKPGMQFNLVFIDPPFREMKTTSDIFLALERYQRLSNQAWIYVESAKQGFFPKEPIPWKKYREKNIGRVNYRLYHVSRSTYNNA